jgi:hypothetical protein
LEEVDSTLQQIKIMRDNDSETQESMLSFKVLTYLLTSWGRILFEKLIVTQLVKEYPAFFMESKDFLI